MQMAKCLKAGFERFPDLLHDIKFQNALTAHNSSTF